MPRKNTSKFPKGYVTLLAEAVVVVGGIATVTFCAVKNEWLGKPVATTVTVMESQARKTTSTTTTTTTTARVAVATENVAGVPSAVSLGFNNADQVVSDGNGTNVIWVENGKVTLATRGENGSVETTTVLDQGAITLPAIARDGDLVAFGWTERVGADQQINIGTSLDDGTTVAWKNMGTGNGLSLAASDGQIAAVWHEGDEDATAKVLFSKFNGTSWSTPIRIDSVPSGKAAVWASVDIKGNNALVTWRDNRDGNFTVWMRRSTDGGATWLSDQHIATKTSGDPVGCYGDNGNVWIAHHGLGKISLLRSTDNGASFGQPVEAGRGYFAHLNCRNNVVVGWEDIIGRHTDPNKKAGYAVYTSEGVKITSGAIEDGSVAATTVYISPDEKTVEILWLKTDTTPLVGTLRHQVLSLE